MSSRIGTRAVEGRHPDEALMIVDGVASGFIIVKGKFDNIAVELDENGWQELAVAALEMSLLADIMPVDREHGLVSALINRAARDKNMTVGDLARRMGVDREAVRSVMEGLAFVPTRTISWWASALGIPPLKLEYASQVDRRDHPDTPDMTVQFGGQRETVGRNKPRRQARRDRS